MSDQLPLFAVPEPPRPIRLGPNQRAVLERLTRYGNVRVREAGRIVYLRRGWQDPSRVGPDWLDRAGLRVLISLKKLGLVAYRRRERRWILTAAGRNVDLIGPDVVWTSLSTLRTSAPLRAHAAVTPRTPLQTRGKFASESADLAARDQVRGADWSRGTKLERASDGIDVRQPREMGGCSRETRHQGLSARVPLRGLPSSEGRGERPVSDPPPTDGAAQTGGAAAARRTDACSSTVPRLGLRPRGDFHGLLPSSQPLAQADLYSRRAAA